MDGNLELTLYGRWRSERLAHWARNAVHKLDGSGPAFLRVPDVPDTIANRYLDLAELLRDRAKEHDLEAYHEWAERRSRAAGRGR